MSSKASGNDSDHGCLGHNTPIVGSGANRFRLSGGEDTITDVSIADGDQVLISSSTKLTIEQIVLRSDIGKHSNTKHLNISVTDLLSHQPELFR